MSELNRPHIETPSGWSMADEGYKKVIRMDYYGQPYEVWEEVDRRPDLGKLWASFRQNFQAGVDYHNSIPGGELRMDSGRQEALNQIENEQL